MLRPRLTGRPSLPGWTDLTEATCLDDPDLARRRERRNPAEVVLRCLRAPDVDARVVEALVWVLVAHADLDWSWLVRPAKADDRISQVPIRVPGAGPHPVDSTDGPAASGQGRILDMILAVCRPRDMAKVTGKFQITLPKAAVTQSGIEVGDTLDIRVNGGALLVTRRTASGAECGRHEQLLHFDRATRRQRQRGSAPKGTTRGWTREEL